MALADVAKRIIWVNVMQEVAEKKRTKKAAGAARRKR